MKMNSIVSLAMDSQVLLDDASSGKLALLGHFYSKPFYCSIWPFCSDKNEFYWSGNAFIGLYQNSIQLSNDKNNDEFTPKFRQQFGGRVTTGSLQGGLENFSPSVLWSGVFPVTIPLSIFYSPGETQYSGATVHLGVTWSGSSVGGKLTGTFSFPQYVWNGISKNVQWWNGKFIFQIQPSWNVTLDGLISSGDKYYSTIHFQSKNTLVSESNNILVKSKLFDGDNTTAVVSAPVVLQGTYTPDKSAFIWNGDFIVSIKNKLIAFRTSTAPKQLEKPNKTDDSLNNKIKPVKPSKPPKLSVSFTVTSGNVFAYNENETEINVWSGVFPVRFNIDRLAKQGGWSVSADVTWKADQVTPELSGQFTVPTYFLENSSYVTEMWYGNFTFKTEIDYGATLEEAVHPDKTYSCRVFFKTQNKLGSNNFETYKTSTQLVSSDLEDSEKGSPCTLLLVGSSVSSPIYCKLLPFLCTERNLFDWNGKGFISFTLPTPPAVIGPEKLQSLKLNTEFDNELGSRTQIFATVLSGNLVGSRESDYPKYLWSGSLPTEIPLPVFWTTDSIDVPVDPQVYGHGVIWSGSQLGTFFEGYFSLPQYAWNGVTSSVQWWNGRFSFLLDPTLDPNLDGLVVRGVKYNSRIVFQDLHTNSILTSPSQYDINNALHVPIILQGTYSSDRKIFYWSGKVIIEFHSKPNPFYPRQYATNSLNFLQGNNMDATDVDGAKSIGIVVTSVNLSGSNKKTTLNFPITIPLKNFTTKNNVIELDWTATAVSETQVIGNFTLRTYTSTENGFTVVPLLMSFSLNIITLFNNSIEIINPGMKYSSIVILKSSKKFDNSNLMFSTTKEATKSKSSVIILLGSLSPDETTFTWAGQAWLKFPHTVSEQNKLTFKLGGRQNLSFKLGEKENLQAPTSVVKRRAGIVATSGNISGIKNGSLETWWTGGLPTVIPLNHLPMSTTDNAVVKVDWIANAVTSTSLEGNFTLPAFSKNITVQPTSGTFSLNLITLFNTSIDIIEPGVKYSSLIIFKSSKSTDFDKLKISTEGSNSSTITLIGSLSTDKTYFTWLGQAWLNFPTTLDDKNIKPSSGDVI